MIDFDRMPGTGFAPTRRMVLASATTIAGVLLSARAAAMSSREPRARVIIDNDFSGDPDGLFQLAHHLMSTSVEIPFVIGSHIHRGDFLDGSTRQAENAVARVASLISAIGIAWSPRVIAGRDAAPSPGAPAAASAATRAIIREAMRSDSKAPLVYAAGAGLTELAEAVRLAPGIGAKLRLIWIGGREWPDLASIGASRTDPEYNFTIDVEAARHVFNDTDIEIWQVPRDVYRQMLVSMAELRLQLRSAGSAGAFLLHALDVVRDRYPDRMGETYILGDSPLVTLTALTSAFEPDSSSSNFVVRPTPMLEADGSYVSRPDGRPMRVYRSIDRRLTFADMFAKLAAAGKGKTLD